ncbi:MAG: hypothetical protein J6Q22_18900 [Prevotella sp.]|nr:hypothetical protein [Prevotella sp.]
MDHPKIVLDTNCLLQILGARSSYHFLFSEFLADRYTLCVSTDIVTDDGHFDDAANSSFPNFRVMGLDEFAEKIRNNV